MDELQAFDDRMRTYIERTRREHLPEERYAIRRQAEAEARDMLAQSVGRLDAAELSQFAKLVNRDLSRYGMPSAKRWGLGLGQPNVNSWARNLAATNALMRRLWESPPDTAVEVFDEIRGSKAPGGDLLPSIVLYLRDPSAFAVFVPAVERGARNLGIVKSAAPVGYRDFNHAVQGWRRDFDVDPVETDVLLVVEGQDRRITEQDGEIDQEQNPIREVVETILADYLSAKTTESFGSNASMWGIFQQLQLELERLPLVSTKSTLSVKASPGVGNWAHVPWAAISDSRAARSIRDGVYCVFLFRQDMTGVYLTLNQGVSEPLLRLGRNEGKAFLLERGEQIRARSSELANAGFQLDGDIDLRASPGLGSDYEISTVAYKFYPAGAVPTDSELTADVNEVLRAYLAYVDGQPPAPPATASNWDTRASQLERAVQAKGFVFEPWQLAAFVTAVRTKPLVILAGVTGTGKTQLPLLTANSTGGVSNVIAVRPDWTDSGELLGYTDLAGVFRPGALLTFAAAAAKDPDRLHVCVLDEMNIGRVEHYLAEVLSAVERRSAAPGGGFQSAALLPSAPGDWGSVRLAPNLVLVGTVNMDESAHGFSRKVIDRAFTLELSDADISRIPSAAESDHAESWEAKVWHQPAIQLAGVSDLDRDYVASVITSLSEANRHLAGAQLQVGYRSRDEIALFGLNARDLPGHFVTRTGQLVDPLDLAIMMKVLPRIMGGGAAVRRALLGLIGWAHGAAAMRSEDDARGTVKAWEAAGRPSAISDVPFPRTAARLCLMWERLEDDGFASYWL